MRYKNNNKIGRLFKINKEKQIILEKEARSCIRENNPQRLIDIVFNLVDAEIRAYNRFGSINIYDIVQSIVAMLWISKIPYKRKKDGDI